MTDLAARLRDVLSDDLLRRLGVERAHRPKVRESLCNVLLPLLLSLQEEHMNVTFVNAVKPRGSVRLEVGRKATTQPESADDRILGSSGTGQVIDSRSRNRSAASSPDREEK